MLAVGVLLFLASKPTQSSPKLGLILAVFSLFSTIASGCILLPITAVGGASSKSVNKKLGKKNDDSKLDEQYKRAVRAASPAPFSSHIDFGGSIPPSSFMLLVSSGVSFLTIAAVTIFLFGRIRAAGGFSQPKNMSNRKEPTDGDRPRSGPRGPPPCPPNASANAREPVPVPAKDDDSRRKEEEDRWIGRVDEGN
ncbi:unnamed protein product [Caenorhabditis sp. 36 PRJEB53466]|nr:unnamed protein product [Caenorhabditis sp. 36 PRJEB53466]